MTYYQYSVQITDDETKNLLIALLSDAGFEGFSEEEKLLHGYIPENKTDQEVIDNILSAYSFNHKRIEEQNWNEIWESSFSPITIDNSCHIRASFHESKADQFYYEIIIDPKMSFGTAHHETTHLMISFILEMNLTNNVIADIGCGTGILSILAEKKHAKKIDALDIDHHAFINCMENIKINECKTITCSEGNVDVLQHNEYDLILANINRNTIVKHLKVYSRMLSTGNNLLISGIYKEDLDIVQPVAIDSGFFLSKIKEKNNWIAALFKKK